MGVDLVMPESQVIMEWTEKDITPITQDQLLARHDALLAATLSREMHVLLTNKTSMQADDRMKPLQSTDGLEAWRLIRIHLSKKLTKESS